ncbi:MAG: hypothetical protein WBL50_10340 [Candidatus Acidiferrum sp.]
MISIPRSGTPHIGLLVQDEMPEVKEAASAIRGQLRDDQKGPVPNQVDGSRVRE